MSPRRVFLAKSLSISSRTTRARKLHPETDREYIVPVLMRSFAILNLLRMTPEGLKIDQIHAQTGVARSTVYRIVRTFVAAGYLHVSLDGSYLAS